MSPDARPALARLRKPDGRVYFAGDHVSNMNAWMQGAFESAREAATAIHARAAQEPRGAESSGRLTGAGVSPGGWLRLSTGCCAIPQV
jgi:hypothetical protein